MLPDLKRRDAVVDEACGTAPHHDVTAFEGEARTGSDRRWPPRKNTAGKPSEAAVNLWPDVISVTVLVKICVGIDGVYRSPVRPETHPTRPRPDWSSLRRRDLGV